jgi:AcrR family transcriptional regulator
MARTVNEQEYAEKRGQILDAAQRLVYTKGYERMTIGDILADLQISSGAFYHYFDSKPGVQRIHAQGAVSPRALSLVRGRL